MQKRILGVPIFKVGHHNGQDFSVDDLKTMAENFYEYRRENPDFQIPIKVGHVKGNEAPAIGWMDNLRVEKDFLLADFEMTSEDSFKSLKEKQYKNRSVEIMNDFVNSAKKKLGRFISGLAVLGSSLPAVNLPDIRFKKLDEAALCFDKSTESEKPELIEIDNFDYPYPLNIQASMQMQTIILSKEKFKNVGEARKWVNDHDMMRSDKVDETDESYRFRQRNPWDFSEESFRTVDIAEGVKAVMGKMKMAEMEKTDDKTTTTTDPKNQTKQPEEVATMDEKNSAKSEDMAASAASENGRPSDSKQPDEKTLLLEKYAFLEQFANSDDIVSALKQFELVKKEKETLEKEKRDMIAMQQKADYDAFTKKMVDDKRLLPKHQTWVNILLSNMDCEKTVEVELEFGKKEKKSVVDIFKLFLNDLPEHGLLATFAQYAALPVPRDQAYEEFAKSKGFASLADFKKQPVDDFKKSVIEFETLFAKRQAVLAN